MTTKIERVAIDAFMEIGNRVIAIRDEMKSAGATDDEVNRQTIKLATGMLEFANQLASDSSPPPADDQDRRTAEEVFAALAKRIRSEMN